MDISQHATHPQTLQTIQFMSQITKLFDIKTKERVRVDLHGYGAETISPALFDQISMNINPFADGEIGSSLVEVLKAIDDSGRPSGKNLLIVFINKQFIETESDAENIKTYIQNLVTKGYHVVAIATDPHFNENEAVNVFPGVTIVNPGMIEKLPEIVLIVERIIGDVIFGKTEFLLLR